MASPTDEEDEVIVVAPPHHVAAASEEEGDVVGQLPTRAHAEFAEGGVVGRDGMKAPRQSLVTHL